ncbi:uncharacterized protein SRS1_16075 [Sporisorium reilianum f. sp. reilianum]|uniref:Uncharacterized protein n=1 Tax=Sporisorium reilianum f. sp. reilianum TaxID=72559 RepID=A0A2N8UK73_9BASI|nr:uncharacterized protein SRS1_16075 [Sporisorium reilianum f. sp. reilianum]
MKSFSTALFALTLLALVGTALSAPLPASSVELHLSDGRVAKCNLLNQPSREKADMVSSKLVASGKLACPSTQEHSAGGKTVRCEQSQLAGTQEATNVLKDACASHQGLHSIMAA